MDTHSHHTFADIIVTPSSHQNDWIDVTDNAHAVGIHAQFVGLSQHVWFEAIEVHDCALSLSTESQLRQLLTLAKRAFMRIPNAQTVSFVVAKPPSKGSVYLHQPLHLVATLEPCEQGAQLVIDTESGSHRRH
ncbi:hypothetical protein [Vibrio sp. 10N.261.46.A3]|uniref:hypothetical protein n=1 Tax=Vibrio sp. 10N.261.46.A3 TaxID=3229658 RepID=UPI0035500780